MQPRLLICALVFALLPTVCLADWTDPGVAYRCDEKNGFFAAMATMKTSSPELAGEVIAEPAYTILPKNDSAEGIEVTELACSVKGTVVSIVLERIPAHERGQCSATDRYFIRSLQVNGATLLMGEQFHGGCSDSHAVFRIEVLTRRGKLLFKSCRGPWDWETGYNEGKCEEHQLIASPKPQPTEK